MERFLIAPRMGQIKAASHFDRRRHTTRNSSTVACSERVHATRRSTGDPMTTCIAKMLCTLAVLSFAHAAAAQSAVPEQEPLGAGLEGFVYPYPVQYLTLRMDARDVKLAFMDVEPTGTANGHTVVLMHGRNFFGAYWKDIVHFLSTKGYRTIVPDQIGFGKSTKPDLPHSLHLHAHNTKLLLDTLGVKKITLVGHSLGG